MSLADLQAALSQATNLSQLKGLSAAYNTLLGGIPTLDGFANLMATNNATNFGAGPGPLFNDENIIINTINALYQGNPFAEAAFNAIVGSGASTSDLLTAVYNFVIPATSRTQEGLDYFIAQSAFYTARAKELDIPDATGAALVAFASLTKIAVDNGIGGLGDSLNDLIKAINNGSAGIPQGGALFTPIEVADGTQFDADDSPAAGSGPVYTISVSPNVVAEGNAGQGSVLTYTVNRSGDVSKAGSVAVLLSGSADASDYTTTLTNNLIAFEPGHDQISFTVTTKPDQVPEPNETVYAALGQITGGGTHGATGIVLGTITNDDGTNTGPVYSIEVSPTRVDEGNTGPGAVVIYTVTRTGDISQPGSVSLTLTGSADLGIDYTLSLTESSVSFAAGASTASFTATVKPDTVVEPEESISFTLSNITGGGTLFAGLTNATAVINDDDGTNTGPVYSIEVSPISVTEGNSGTGPTITYTVSRTGDVSKAGAVGLTTLGTATSGVDYDLSTATSIVSFAAGASTATLTAILRPDTQAEANETITILLDSVGGGGIIGPANSATATILNDDAASPAPFQGLLVGFIDMTTLWEPAGF